MNIEVLSEVPKIGWDGIYKEVCIRKKFVIAVPSFLFHVVAMQWHNENFSFSVVKFKWKSYLESKTIESEPQVICLHAIVMKQQREGTLIPEVRSKMYRNVSGRKVTSKQTRRISNT